MAPTSMQKPRLRMTSVTIGSSQPLRMAGFYADLLGWPVTVTDPAPAGMPEQAGWAQVKPPDGTGLTLNFEYEQFFSRPVWPAEARAQTASQHLDIQVDNLDSAVEWAEACGARLADSQPQEHVRVMIDPDGQPFCLYL
jgi:catechol 2,3-dioxygenase-like lactoylglutathione lyase family enzyme